MYALNFYSPIVADQLRTRRKTATIRLCGSHYSPRDKIFDAVVDKVEVKKLGELSPNEIEHDNPELRSNEELAAFLARLYNRDVSVDDTVTLIRFSEIKS